MERAEERSSICTRSHGVRQGAYLGQERDTKIEVCRKLTADV